MWFKRWMNYLGLRHDILVCIHQDDTWRWPSHLGEKTSGACSKCEGPIFFEKQNKSFKKVCNRCSPPMFSVSVMEGGKDGSA